MLTSIRLRRREKILHLAEYSLVLERRFALGFGVAGEQVTLGVVERGRDAHRHVDVLVAAAGALQKLHAFAAEAEDLVRLRACRDAQRLGAVDRVGLDLGAEGGLGEGDGLLGMNVVVAVRELRVLVDGDEYVQIAGRTAIETGFPFAGHAQARAIVDAGGDFDGDIFLLAHAAGAVAVRAGILDHFAGAAALRARAGDSEEAL